MPPTIGAVLRFITRDPIPIGQRIGKSPKKVVATAMNLGLLSIPFNPKVAIRYILYSHVGWTWI
jgi:hypothetical protein